ncbi:type III-A CRISPR-associated RAMP protein Csm3 [Pleomorphovibrio marinus]|uniref:type III-A CRISPR-associated RAMP protein Csm3 n=1 Tax=Pleomorphovibrio marinus TaxID=2164132 RepID=UPI000E0A8D50|nr:type III-A CRISPR-associated RAMP protein Csm3 [Pleomorphovibrio marinus]
MSTNKLNKKIKFTGQLELLTGLHIGDSKENLQIGGIDSGIIRRKDNYQPYIPGSSLKGKIRSLLERKEGINADNKFKNDGSTISKIFGNTDCASRVIFRDSYLTPESVEKFEKSDFLDLPFAEVKTENIIDRVLGKAKNGGLRSLERVPAGVKFNYEIILNIYENDSEEEFIKVVDNGINLLELDYLGGSGSRGYGHVKFHNTQKETIDLNKISISP